MDENEIKAIQEENETLKGEKEAAAAELEQLKGQLAERDAAFSPLREELGQLKGELTAKDTELKTGAGEGGYRGGEEIPGGGAGGGEGAGRGSPQDATRPVGTLPHRENQTRNRR